MQIVRSAVHATLSKVAFCTVGWVPELLWNIVYKFITTVYCAQCHFIAIKELNTSRYMQTSSSSDWECRKIISSIICLFYCGPLTDWNKGKALAISFQLVYYRLKISFFMTITHYKPNYRILFSHVRKQKIGAQIL